MAKTRSQKDVILSQYKSLLADVPGYIVVNSDKVNSAALTDLKKKLRPSGAKFVVVKNSIFKIALQELQHPLQTQEFNGPTAVITYSSDPTEAAKIVKAVQKELSLLEAKYGYIDGAFVAKDKIMSLAEIPSKPELLAKMLGSMNSPVSGIMNMFSGNVSAFSRLLKQLSER